jgi:hypothetical protein
MKSCSVSLAAGNNQVEGPSRRIKKMRRALRRSGMDRKIYIAFVGIVGVAIATGLCDLLFAVFPMKAK